MRDSLADAREFHLAEWRVTPSACRLQCGQINRYVAPRLMRLLLALASRSRQVVSKKELVDRVWDNDDVSDDSLCTCIYQLRKALDDKSGRPRYIETIPKCGYRMLVDPEFYPATSSEPPSEAEPTAPPRRATALPAGAALPPATRLLPARALDVLPRRSPNVRHRAVATGFRGGHNGFPADAVDADLRGRGLLGSQRPSNLLQAKLYFEHALAREPRFAAAHARLASIHVALHFNQHGAAPWAEHARCNARAALELDPMLGEAHAAHGGVLGFVDVDLAAADAEYRTAFELQPELVLARRHHALLLAYAQRCEDALHQLAEAARYDPVNVTAQRENAHIFFILRRFDRAADELLKLLLREPRSWTAYAKLAFIHWIRGNSTEVHATYRAAAAACDSHDLVARLDAAFEEGGAAGLYAAVAGHLERRDPQHRLHLPELIATYIAAGDHERALQLLERGCEQGRAHVLWMLRSPYVDRLHADAAFGTLAARYRAPIAPPNA
jgi:DNA-binding winged helix-turn-helix (wHTH) protein